MSEIKRYGLVRASKKTGAVDTVMEGLGCAMMQLWALQNTTKTKRTVIFEFDTGVISSIYEGDASGFPKVKLHLENEGIFMEEDFMEMFRKDAIRSRKED